MAFTLLEMDGTTLFMVYVVAACIGLAIFYYIVEAAVKNGMVRADAEIKKKESKMIEHMPQSEKPATTEKEKLQRRYDKGEINFEEYQKEWAKL